MMRALERNKTEQVRIRREQYKRVVALAERNERTLIMQLTILLDKALSEEDRTAEAQQTLRKG